MTRLFSLLVMMVAYHTLFATLYVVDLNQLLRGKIFAQFVVVSFAEYENFLRLLEIVFYHGFSLSLRTLFNRLPWTSWLKELATFLAILHVDRLDGFSLTIIKVEFMHDNFISFFHYLAEIRLALWRIVRLVGSGAQRESKEEKKNEMSHILSIINYQL